MIKIIFSLIIFLIVSSGQRSFSESKKTANQAIKVDQRKKDKVVGQVLGSINNIKIPKQLIKIMENKYIEEFKLSDPVRAAQYSNTEVMLNSNRRYLNLTLEIYDNKGLVIENPVIFKPPNGGGIIDMGPYIRNVRGNFYFKLNAYLDEGSGYEKEAPDLSVFFLSNGKKRKVLDQMVGAGCNKFMDVSSYFDSKMSAEGLKLNSTQRRFLSVVGGTFFFIYTVKDELYLASLKVIDSKYSEYLCRS